MKNSAEIRECITEKMASMIKYPQMWVDTAIGLESQYINMLSLILFIDEVYTNPRSLQKLMSDWHKFVHREIGFSGNETVATWLKKNDKSDEVWRTLADLLLKFHIQSGH